ncbi:glycerol-3-phosphate-acyltransferase [Trametes versicolor FP-101664 SS1]|uniref:glycerol-3-phosphate-acyltransferase n=1 Tax=Trametes versicolor (strain FP-101664) TaxID=717944 RepID=UPI0004622028|nr:glycerol-3-phosphate-acyltransferase [Trametes versicolor FP-101664 SS1]EIW63578.1 glycerol-3-phosphate-acyltransferase [Trametes versicolor FP-101664 SS1]
MSEAYLAHRIIRRIASWAVVSFFTEIHVIGSENVPRDGPIIATATHHNMMLDPAILSCAFPHLRVLHYWAKASLFANPVMKYILTSAGNIPVDRKASDKQLLFRGTFRTLAAGEAVALFPEGTSYTEPHIMQVKDGAAWAALEYTKWVKENPDKVKKGAENVMIIPAAIVYTNKSKYRSQAIMEFGQPIRMDDYMGQFISEQEGAPRAAVKRLTAAIERELTQLTINAPDWDTLYAARMARDLLWPEERSINLDDFVAISQTLVDLFSTSDLVPNINAIRRHLLTYYSLLQTTHLTNAVLSSLPLPATLDPRQPVPLPSRLYTLVILVRDTLSLLVRLPFSIVPIVIHAPAYVMGRVGAGLVEDEEETQAQNKVVFGLLLLFMIYPAAFFAVWAFLQYTPVGAVVAVGFVFLFALYHNKLINDNYERAKRLVAAWRILVGMWAPRRWDLSLSAVAQYTVPRIPPENPWVDRARAKKTSRPATPGPHSGSESASESSAAPAQAQAQDAAERSPSPAPSASSAKSSKRRRPPTRRVVRHILRARVEAAKALASLLAQLERAPETKRVCASVHLARAYGGSVDTPAAPAPTADGVQTVPEPTGWRSAREVVAFLRKRGAKITTLEDRVEGDWAALSSDGEDSEPVTSDKTELEWVPPSRD